MGLQATGLLVLLCFTGRETHAWRLLMATVTALGVTILIFAFFPADGRYVICGLNAPDIPTMKGICNFSSTIQAIKYDGVRTIETSMLTGVVSFPSFHAAAAALLVWGAWSIKWARIPAAVLNGVMLVSTIVVGAHYLIDIVGGLVVAAASVSIAVKCVRSKQGEEPAAPPILAMLINAPAICRLRRMWLPHP
jgi:membrane-associated phospholipid phosphatase